MDVVERPAHLAGNDDPSVAAPRSPDSPLYAGALAPRAASPSPPSGVQRKLSVSQQMAAPHCPSSCSSPGLALKLQHVEKDASPPSPPHLDNGRWRSTSSSDVISSRCVT